MVSFDNNRIKWTSILRDIKMLYAFAFYILGLVISILIYTFFMHDSKSDDIDDSVVFPIIVWPATLLLFTIIGILIAIQWPFEKLFKIALKYKRLKSET